MPAVLAAGDDPDPVRETLEGRPELDVAGVDQGLELGTGDDAGRRDEGSGPQSGRRVALAVVVVVVVVVVVIVVA